MEPEATYEHAYLVMQPRAGFSGISCGLRFIRSIVYLCAQIESHGGAIFLKCSQLPISLQGRGLSDSESIAAEIPDR
jgi:hypothetical protein